MVASLIANYQSSFDVTNIGDGRMSYSLTFDSALIAAAKIMMIEYCITTTDAIYPTNDNTRFDYVANSDVTQTGIANQLNVAVDSTRTARDSTAIEYIKFRLYRGSLTTSDVYVTDWSNELFVYPPPTTPTIFVTDISGAGSVAGAYYESGETSDTLYVLMKEEENDFDYDQMRFIVCYFFQDETNATVWAVSDRLPATPTTLGNSPFRLLTVPDIGRVSDTTQTINVSIHAVYDWVGEDENAYHAVSYISNEVNAIPASSDNSPDITSVVYNVYDSFDVSPSVPGNQTITVTWLPPGNSVLPFYQVSYYQIYYSLGTTLYTLYASNIPPTTLEYTVNIGSTGLNLTCGQAITFRVDAITTQGDTEPSAVSSPAVNVFKYSQAVTGLNLTNVSYDSEGETVSFTVNFTGVSSTGSPNKGCGAGLAYVIEINGSIYSPSAGDLTYNSGQTYAISYSNLNITQTGDIAVYLTTTNTNPSPPSPLAGLTAEIPYIANPLTLDAVDYLVYTNGNNDQSMVLTWSNPSLGSWTVSSFDVLFSTDGGSSWNTAGSTLGNVNTYSFDASDYLDSVTNIIFKIQANVVNGSSGFIIYSNEASEYTFTYASAPTEQFVQWAAANPANTLMDVYVTFSNPLSTGTNDGLMYFSSQVYDSNDQAIGSPITTNYNELTSSYVVAFNELTYAATGYVVTLSFVTDPNTSTDMTFADYQATANFSTDNVPQFLDVVKTGGVVTGSIVTHNLLKPVGVVVFPSGATMASLQYSTITPNTSGFDISYVSDPGNGTYVYSFTLTSATFFGATIPSTFSISAANDAGIGLAIV